jgi:glycosyltransferase involved in cell wall biosynthesis
VRDIAESRGVPRDKLIVLPIGVEIPDQPPARLPTVHLFVGRFVEKKGIAVLAEAMRRLRARGDQTQLICVGDGPLRPLLATLAQDVPGITLTGWLPPDAVRTHMTQAVSLVVPSIIAADGDA